MITLHYRIVEDNKTVVSLRGRKLNSLQWKAECVSCDIHKKYQKPDSFYGSTPQEALKLLERYFRCLLSPGDNLISIEVK